MYGKNCNLRTLSREYDCLAKIGTKEAFTLLLENKGQHAPTQTDNPRTKIYDEKKSSFVADFGCNR